MWAPSDSLKFEAGISFSRWSLSATDDAYERYQSDSQSNGWDEIQRRCHKSMMHSCNGNGNFLFLLLSVLLAVCSAMLGACSSHVDVLFVVNLCCCVLSLMCAKTLFAKRKKPRAFIGKCRFIGKQRSRVICRRSHWNRSRWMIPGLCVSSLLTVLALKVSCSVSPMTIPVFPKGTVWCLPRKHRNKAVHALNGNTVSRTRWETSSEAQGIQLCHPDEIELPGDSASQALRSDQVSDGAVGYAFCNQVALAPKLRARGGSYLLLIVPGELGHDLRQQLNDVSVNLVGNSFCMTLTCFDPVAKKAFPRKVVCINLGLQNCKAAELKPHVQVDADDSQIVCVNAYAKYNRDDWHELCSQKQQDDQVPGYSEYQQDLKNHHCGPLGNSS